MDTRSAPPPVRDARVARRLSFQFSAEGDYGACVLAGGAARPAVEYWSMAGSAPMSRILRGTPAVGAQLLPAGQGRVLVIQQGRGGHRLVLATSYGERAAGFVRGPALRGVPSRTPGVLAWLLMPHGSGRTVVYAVGDDDLDRRAVAAFDSVVTGSVWWSADGRVFTAETAAGGGRRILRVDTATGRSAYVPVNARIRFLAAAPDGRLFASALGPGGPVAGWLNGDGTRLRCPPPLVATREAPRPLAFSPDGTRLALRLTEGARSRLLLAATGSDEVDEVALPPGVVRTAGWGRRGLHMLYTDPLLPPTLVTVPAGGNAIAVPGAGLSGQVVRTEVFAGPAGPIEAVCHGDRRTARHVVIALHGGPEAAWELAYEPVLRGLAAAGIAVVAPNQRGSTGYGAEHRHAIRGAWGGPDLDDVLRVRQAVAGDRPGLPAPSVYGTSYGAYLALLAVAAAPDGWSRCVAVAPFLSPQRLYDEAGEAVRAMIDRLDGRAVHTDAFGPRDLELLAERVAVPVMCVHGVRDDVIPVGEARRLVALLARSSQPATGDVRYREIPDGDHDPFTGPGGADLLAEVAAFVRGER